MLALFNSINSAVCGALGINTYLQGVIIMVCINTIAVLGMSVLTGFTRLFSFGNAGFMSIGAYTAAILTVKFNVNFLLAIILGALFAGFIAFLLGSITLRLKGDYLAIITLGFGEIIRVVLTNIDSVLGFKFTYGAAGLKRIPKISSFTLVFLCVALTCLIIHMVMKSRHGRAILSIRENEIAAESCGVNTTYYKVMAFVLSAFFAGIAGCLYAGYLGSLYPSTFKFMKSIEILVMVVLGGMGSMLGSVLSATVLTILPELLRSVADYRMVAYSLLLVLMMIFRPKGLMGTYDFSLSRILEKLMNGGTRTGKEGAQK